MSLRENTSNSLVSLHFRIAPIGFYVKPKKTYFINDKLKRGVLIYLNSFLSQK